MSTVEGRWSTALLAAALAGFAFLVLYTAWLSDDAYITFRTIDNWRHGFGLRWNVVERVQAYTHPLWMFALRGAWSVTGEPYFSSLGLSLACSLAAVAVVAFRIAPTRATGALAVALLAVSRAFVDYSTSGLENPLTHLLLALFLVAFWWNDGAPRRVLVATALAALVMLTRLDLSVLVTPALAAIAWRTRGRGWLAMVAGMAPLIAWEIFSIVYYGFLFPNTAYAKLPYNVPSAQLIPHGVAYLADSWSRDPIVLATLAAAVLITVVEGLRAETLAVSAGILAYLLFVVRVGGDFMSGRFLSAPYLVAVAILVRGARRPSWRVPVVASGLVLALVGAVTGGPVLITQPATMDPRPFINADEIADERCIYSVETRLFAPLSPDPDPYFLRAGRQAREKGSSPVVFDLVGMYGYGAGPRIFVVDHFALADPLLARLPATQPFRIGHYNRQIPAGYLETIASGDVRIEDPRLADYYRNLILITRGPIWSAARWQAILAFNFGHYRPSVARLAGW